MASKENAMFESVWAEISGDFREVLIYDMIAEECWLAIRDGVTESWEAMANSFAWQDRTLCVWFVRGYLTAALQIGITGKPGRIEPPHRRNTVPTNAS